MAIFAVMSQGDPAELAASVRQNFASNYFELEPGKWFITADGLTAKDVSYRLGMGEPSNLPGVVVTVEGYFGRARSDLWEWLKAKATATALHA